MKTKAVRLHGKMDLRLDEVELSDKPYGGYFEKYKNKK